MAGFTDLQLERRAISTELEAYLKSREDEYVISDLKLISEPSNQYRLNIEVKGQQGQIEIYFKKNGKTTFVNNNKNELKDFIDNALNHVISKTSYDLNINTYTVANIAQDDFDILVEFLQEDCYAKKVKEGVTSEHQSDFVKLESPDGDIITLTRFNNGKMNIQGRPLRLFNELMSMLGQFDINNIISLSDIKFDKKNIEDELHFKMTESYSCLPGKCKEALLASLTLAKYELDVYDYSYVVFPALRTLEGHLKKVLCEFGVYANSDDYIKCFEKNHATSKQVFKEGCAYGLDKKVKKSLEKTYDYYYNTRNILFHQTSVFNNRVISKISEARLIVDEVIELIGEYYKISIE